MSDEPIGSGEGEEEDVYSEQMTKTIMKLRRAVDDLNEDNYAYANDVLYGYIQDAVDELEIGQFKRNIKVDNGDFVTSGGSAVEVSGPDQSVYVIKAQIVMKFGKKDKADRENFLLRKNRLTVDTTNQSKDHSDTLDKLEERLKRAILQSTFSSVKGVRVE